jgi:hypothetical protein
MFKNLWTDVHGIIQAPYHNYKTQDNFSFDILAQLDLISYKNP